MDGQGETAVRSADMICVKEVMDRMGIKESKAYGIIRSLNRELKDRGYITVSGRVPRRFFEERTYLKGGE